MTLVPTGAAQIEFRDVTVNLGPEQIHAELMGHQFEGTEAQGLREWIDEEYGDGDQSVSQDELDGYLQTRKEELNDDLRVGGAFVFAPFTVNEQPARAREVVDLRLSESVLGDTSSTDTILYDVEAKLTFWSTEKSRVAYSFEQDFSVPFRQVEPPIQWVNATFRPIEPWSIDPSSVSPGGSDNPFFSDGVFTVPYEESGDFSSTDEALTFEIVDTTQEDIKTNKSKKSPGPAVLPLLVLLFAALLATRRHPRRKA